MDFFKHTITSVEDLIPYALNSRTHSDEQVAQLSASIREFGFTNPVLIDDSNNLIAGHGRVLAARKLKMDTVPAIVVTGLDDRKRRALVIADNKLALNADWDIDALLDVWPIFEAFQLTYVSKGLLLEQEKNASALSPSGPSAGASATAKPARKPARTARRG